MIREIVNGMDVHADNAIRQFGADPSDSNFGEIRTAAKVLSFRLLYGGTPYAFFMDGNMPNFSLKKWTKIVDSFYSKYEGLRRWQEDNYRVVNTTGKLVSPSGRVLKFKTYPLKKNREEYVGYKWAQICNYPVQSFATADVMPLAMNEIRRKKREAKMKSLLSLQVHDSLVFDARHKEVIPLSRLIVETFEDLPRLVKATWGFEIPVPMSGDIEYGKSYGALKPLAREKYMA